MAINAPVQGTAADMLKLAMVELARVIKDEHLEDEVRLLLQVHDRAVRWRPLSLQSIELAAAGHLILVSEEGEVIPLSRTKARSLPDEVKQLLTDAEKLGAWCGQLTLHEVTTTLKVKL